MFPSLRSTVFLLIFISLSSGLAGGLLALLGLWLYDNATAIVQPVDVATQVHLPQSLPVSTHVKTKIDMDFDQIFDLSIPIDNEFLIHLPRPETLNISFDTQIPLDLTIHYQDKVRIKTQVPVDAEIETRVFGIKKMVQIKGEVPIDLELPLDVRIPIQQTLPVSFKGPVQLSINQPIAIPVKTQLDTRVPIKTQLQVPLDFGISTDVALGKQAIDADVHIPALEIPLKNLSLLIPPKPEQAEPEKSE